MTTKKFPDIYRRLQEYIARYGLSDGDRLPSEKKLAEMFGVAHITLRKALDMLAADEIIHKLPSKGNFAGKRPRPAVRSGLIGIIIPEKEPFFFDIIASLEKQMQPAYAPLLRFSRRDPLCEKEILETFARQNVDGIIATPNRRCADLYRSLEMPTVFFDNMIDGLNIPYVLNDDYHAGLSATEYLINLGHRRIAYVGGLGDHSSTQRHNGFRAAMVNFNLKLPEEYDNPREYSREWGYAAAEKLFRLPQPPTAVFCGNDTIASGLLRYLLNYNIKCPDTVSVIGCCNSPFSEDIGLSTVDQHPDKLSAYLWNTLQTLLAGKTASPAIVLPSHLILRRTTARAPA